MPNSPSESGRIGIAAIQRILSEFRNDCDEWQCEFENLLEDTATALADPYHHRQPRGNEHGGSWAELNRRLGDEREERRQEQADLTHELRELRLLVETQVQLARSGSSALTAVRSADRAPRSLRTADT